MILGQLPPSITKVFFNPKANFQKFAEESAYGKKMIWDLFLNKRASVIYNIFCIQWEKIALTTQKQKLEPLGRKQGEEKNLSGI